VGGVWVGGGREVGGVWVFGRKSVGKETAGVCSKL